MLTAFSYDLQISFPKYVLIRLMVFFAVEIQLVATFIYFCFRFPSQRRHTQNDISKVSVSVLLMYYIVGSFFFF